MFLKIHLKPLPGLDTIENIVCINAEEICAIESDIHPIPTGREEVKIVQKTKILYKNGKIQIIDCPAESIMTLLQRMLEEPK